MQPGEQWKPHNSSDGVFMENICCWCEHDRAFRNEEGDSCKIAANMYANGGDPAWVIGLDGKPFCKAFKREGGGYRCPNTSDLFDKARTT